MIQFSHSSQFKFFLQIGCIFHPKKKELKKKIGHIVPLFFGEKNCQFLKKINPIILCHISFYFEFRLRGICLVVFHFFDRFLKTYPHLIMQNPAWIRLIMQNQTNGRKKKPLKSSQNLPSFLTTNIIKGIRHQFFFFSL